MSPGHLRKVRARIHIRHPNCSIPAQMHDATVGVIPESLMIQEDHQLQVRTGQ